MVDVSGKAETVRRAVAGGRVRMMPETLAKIKSAGLKKGDVLATARIAGILAAKKTPDIIPLCHPVMLGSINIDFSFSGDDAIDIKAEAVSRGQTGIEMEAMLAVAAAALTIYDMAKSADRGMTIEDIRLISKSGGKSGQYRHAEEETGG